MQTKAIFALLLLFLSAHSIAQQKDEAVAKKPDYKVLGSPLPTVRFVDSSGVVYNNDSLRGEDNLFIMMFNPTCEHCEAMAVNMAKNIQRFGDAKIFLVAAAGMKPYLNYFYNDTKVGNCPRIKVTLDSCDFINKTFLYKPLPQVNVYNPKRRLIKIFTETETVEPLKAYLPKAKKKKHRAG